jgi:hypothetical protein
MQTTRAPDVRTALYALKPWGGSTPAPCSSSGAHLSYDGHSASS